MLISNLVVFKGDAIIFSDYFHRLVRSAAKQVVNKRSRAHGNGRITSGIENLEPRLLFSDSATAQLSLTSTTGSGGSPVYHYDIAVKNTGTTNIGTFWFGWIPGEDFLPTAPLSESSPTGWSPAVTGSNDSTDGSAIEWVATSHSITPGQTLSGFDFTSADSPAQLSADSPTHPGEPVTTSFVYITAAFGDAGDQFTVTPPATTAPSTTTVVPSQSTINHGGSVTFTATVAPSSGSGTDPTGTVTFLANGNSIGTGNLQNGVATLTSSSLNSGSLSITAQYAGDSTYSSSTSAAITETVNPPAATTTTLVSSNPSVQAGTSVTFTATVAPVAASGTTPTGSVTFNQGSALLGSTTLGLDGTAQLITTTLPIGVDPITATYSGDEAFDTSTSTATNETISTGTSPTTTALTTSAPSITNGGSVTFTAAVAAVTPGGPTPTGIVTFTQDATTLGTQAVQSDGSAAFTTTTLPVGTDNITATYSGDGTYAASASTALAETVANPATLVPTIAKSTLPAALVSGTAAHGAATLSIANSTTSAIKGKITVQLFATTDGVIDGSAIKLANVVRSLNVKTTKPTTTALPIKIAGATLPAGTYTLVARVIDLSGNAGDSPAGASLTVAAPFVLLSETFTKMTVPTTAVAGAKTNAVTILKITNNGNITTGNSTTAALFASLSGVIDGNATQLISAAKPLRIRPGKSANLTLHMKQIPSLPAGAYTVLAQVTDQNGGLSTAVSSVVNIT